MEAYPYAPAPPNPLSLHGRGGFIAGEYISHEGRGGFNHPCNPVRGLPLCTQQE